MQCCKCKGTGKIKSYPVGLFQIWAGKQMCPDCGGSGEEQPGFLGQNALSERLKAAAKKKAESIMLFKEQWGTHKYGLLGAFLSKLRSAFSPIPYIQRKQ